MPVIKSAIKKLRQDRKRERVHDAFRKTVRDAVKKAAKDKKAESMSEAFSLIDKAAKKHILHKNRAARLKSRLSKVTARVAPNPKKLSKEPPAKISPAPRKKTAKSAVHKA